MDPIWTVVAKEDATPEVAATPMGWGDLALGEALLERLARPLSRPAIAALQAAIGHT